MTTKTLFAALVELKKRPGMQMEKLLLAHAIARKIDRGRRSRFLMLVEMEVGLMYSSVLGSEK
ncbi:MAG TPA: hypothetical protein V6D07_18705 [Trichocoleus sp.]